MTTVRELKDYVYVYSAASFVDAPRRPARLLNDLLEVLSQIPLPRIDPASPKAGRLTGGIWNQSFWYRIGKLRTHGIAIGRWRAMRDLFRYDGNLIPRLRDFPGSLVYEQWRRDGTLDIGRLPSEDQEARLRLAGEHGSRFVAYRGAVLIGDDDSTDRGLVWIGLRDDAVVATAKPRVQHYWLRMQPGWIRRFPAAGGSWRHVPTRAPEASAIAHVPAQFERLVEMLGREVSLDAPGIEGLSGEGAISWVAASRRRWGSGDDWYSRVRQTTEGVCAVVAPNPYRRLIEDVYAAAQRSGPPPRPVLLVDHERLLELLARYAWVWVLSDPFSSWHDIPFLLAALAAHEFNGPSPSRSLRVIAAGLRAAKAEWQEFGLATLARTGMELTIRQSLSEWEFFRLLPRRTVHPDRQVLVDSVIAAIVQEYLESARRKGFVWLIPADGGTERLVALHLHEWLQSPSPDKRATAVETVKMLTDAHGGDKKATPWLRKLWRQVWGPEVIRRRNARTEL